MRLLAILFSAFLTASCGTTKNQPYPSEWPSLVGMSLDCREVNGIYIDPNVMHWKFESYDAYGGSSKRGGKLEAAWHILFPGTDGLRLEDTNVKSRAFSLNFDEHNSLAMEYIVDGKIVSSKTIPRESLSCGKDGLTMTTTEKTGAVMDKIPSYGKTSRIATLYRLGSHIYVKSMDNTSGVMVHVLPFNYHDEEWYRFSSSVP